MQLAIEKMRISNFKGIRSLEIDFSETVTAISGRNGSGKSSIADAFTWTLWNKDAHGNAPGSDNFREKPLDASGVEIHGLDTEVELTCRLDGLPFNLKRIQRENWVKRRGSSEAVFQGNVSTYYINDVEQKLQDFKARIAAIATEDVFRLIGSLSAFNQMEWKKRREQLLILSGTDVDAALLSQSMYRVIADETAQRNVTVDDLKKIMSDQRKRLNDEIKMMPVRIDEARRALPEAGFIADVRAAERVIQEMEAAIEDFDREIADASATSNEATVRQEVLALETELVSLKRRVQGEYDDEHRRLAADRDHADQCYRIVLGQMKDASLRLTNSRDRLKPAIAERDRLRLAYTAMYESKFESAAVNVCPACGQDIPPELAQAAMEKAQADFSSKRKAALADIREKGIIAASAVESIEESMLQTQGELEELAQRKAEADMRCEETAARLSAHSAAPLDYASEPRIAAVEEQLARLRGSQSAPPSERLQEIKRRRAEAQAALNAARETLARRDAGKATQLRIETLENQQRELGARASETEQLIVLIEQFTMDRCAALEDSINSRFPTVRWKLFDTQINGSIVDCCQAMIPCESGLVPYESANTAARAHADLQIVDVLSKHYGVSLPIFVDGSESYNTLPRVDFQLITLAVSTDSALRIEKREEKKEVA